MDCQFVFKSQRTQRTRRKATLGRAVRARKVHVRPGGLKGHGGLRTPCFGFGKTTKGKRRREPQMFRRFARKTFGISQI